MIAEQEYQEMLARYFEYSGELAAQPSEALSGVDPEQEEYYVLRNINGILARINRNTGHLICRIDDK